MSDVTHLLEAAAAGEANAADELLPLVYDELSKLASARLAAEKPGQTLEPTALVHEAYLRLVGDCQFAGCQHFFRSEEHTSELQSLRHLVCRLLLEKKKKKQIYTHQ